MLVSNNFRFFFFSEQSFFVSGKTLCAPSDCYLVCGRFPCKLEGSKKQQIKHISTNAVTRCQKNAVQVVVDVFLRNFSMFHRNIRHPAPPENHKKKKKNVTKLKINYLRFSVNFRPSCSLGDSQGARGLRSTT